MRHTLVYPPIFARRLPPQQRGVVALGTPIGAPEYVRAWGAERLEAESALLCQLPELPVLQCAWLPLSFCAAPRANHALRAPYAEARDAAAWGTLQACLGAAAEDEALPDWDIALGLSLLLSQATRTSPAAYWAAGADALTLLRERCPAFSAGCLQSRLDGRAFLGACSARSLP